MVSVVENGTEREGLGPNCSDDVGTEPSPDAQDNGDQVAPLTGYKAHEGDVATL